VQKEEVDNRVDGGGEGAQITRNCNQRSKQLQNIVNAHLATTAVRLQRFALLGLWFVEFHLHSVVVVVVVVVITWWY
jgi:hypothetical protein